MPVTATEGDVAAVTRRWGEGLYSWREDVMAGGLMSYGPSQTDAQQCAAVYMAQTQQVCYQGQ
jgi:hypothetical protein